MKRLYEFFNKIYEDSRLEERNHLRECGGSGVSVSGNSCGSDSPPPKKRRSTSTCSSDDSSSSSC